MKMFFRTRKLARNFAAGTGHTVQDANATKEGANSPKHRWYITVNKKAS